MLPVLIFGTTQPLLNYTRQVCAEFPDICVYKIIPTFPTGRALDQLIIAYNPHIILFELNSDPEVLAFLSAVQLQHPGVALVGFADDKSETVVSPHRNEHRAWAAKPSISVLVPPFSAEELFQYVIDALDRSKVASNSEVAIFLPSKAGSGTTLTALNMARFLSSDLKRKVLLVDADLGSRSLSILLNPAFESSAGPSLNAWQPIDDAAWNRAVVSTGTIDFLPATVGLNNDNLSRWDYRRILAYARSRYQSIYVDFPDVIDQAEVLLAEATWIYLVCTPSRVSLQRARGKIRELVDLGVPERKIRVILNGLENKGPAIEQIEVSLSRKVYSELPFDPVSPHAAAQENGFLDASSPLGSALRSIAWHTAGLTPPQSANAQPVRKSLLGVLRTFATKSERQ